MPDVYQYEGSTISRMKKSIILICISSALLSLSVFGQTNSPHHSSPANTNLTSLSAVERAPEIRYNLDFKGGTPQQLVKAIEESSGKPINVIIPEEDGNILIPPLKMTLVTTEELFDAIKKSSYRSITYYLTDQSSNFLRGSSSYGFESDGKGNNRVWYFKVQKPSTAPTEKRPGICHFYQLKPYLKNYKIEDIITAIQTGWSMANKGMPYSQPITLKFLPETGLLIAVGKEKDHALIEQVIKELRGGNFNDNVPSPSQTTEKTDAKKTGKK